MKTWKARLAVLVVVLAAAAGCSNAAAPAPARQPGTQATLRVGQLRSNLEPLLLAAGQLRGLTYTLQWSNFAIGPDAIAAQNAGAVDVAYMADTPAIFAQAAGVDVKIVGLTRAPQGAQNVALLVDRNSGITSVKDLAGKKVAVVPGTVTQYLLVRALERAGLSLHDLSQVPLQGPEAVQALRRRDVDAVVLVDPLLAKALTDRDARVLVDGVGLLSGSNVLVATHDVLEEPDRVRAVADLLKRVKAALSWAQQHPKQWATVYASTNQLPADAALQAVHRASTTLVPIDAAAIASQQTQADTFARIGLLKHPLNVMQEFDQRFDGGLFGAR